MDESRQPTHHGYAVNVKDRQLYAQHIDYGELGELGAEALYVEHVEDFWRLAVELAHEHGFRDVYGEGRMGGWAVPYPQPHGDEDEDELAAWVRNRFRPFERELLALMDGMRDDFREALAGAIEREPAERAHWAARDVVTA